MCSQTHWLNNSHIYQATQHSKNTTAKPLMIVKNYCILQEHDISVQNSNNIKKTFDNFSNYYDFFYHLKTLNDSANFHSENEREGEVLVICTLSMRNII